MKGIACGSSPCIFNMDEFTLILMSFIKSVINELKKELKSLKSFIKYKNPPL